jgi:xanthine dehydrogenase accessory factor
MRADLLRRAADLEQRGVPFAVATVIRREPASSAQVGNTAIIEENGAFHGWLGGSCIRPTVAREAAAAIADGVPRLIALSPDPRAESRPGVTALAMTCHSGGSVDIYIEPLVPAARLLVFGVSPVARALARLAPVLGYAVDAIDPEADASTFPTADRLFDAFPAGEFTSLAPGRPRLFAVVATQGQFDEEAIAHALSAGPVYLGVVASRKRYSQITQTLLARGVAADALARVTNPAGIDIGARAPEEIALSILAEIVRVRHSARAAEAAASKVAAVADLVEDRDPVCGMTVSAASTHRAEHGGRVYHFCCGGCRERFAAGPERFLSALTS